MSNVYFNKINSLNSCVKIPLIKAENSNIIYQRGIHFNREHEQWIIYDWIYVRISVIIEALPIKAL